MSTVQQVLKAVKQEEVFSVNPEDTISVALHLMAKKNIGAVLVMEGEQLVGILTERDICRKIALQDKSTHTSLVGHAMTPSPECVSPYAVLEECEALMAEMNVRHLPVVDRGKVVGVISMKDVLVATRKNQEFLAMQYEAYIRGRQ